MTNFRQLIDGPEFSDLDRHFAGFIELQAGGNRPLLALAAALVSRARSEGNICLDLAAMAGTMFPEKPADDAKPLKLPALSAWLKELKAAPAVGSPGEFSPLVLDAGNRLYLHRYWEYEQTLAAEILRRAKAAPENLNEPLLAEKIKSLFPAKSGSEIDLQSIAALAAARKNICVITGGPGTGKTHTLVLTLALLLELDATRKLRIAVAAPTGKAAARIQESIRKIKAALTCDDNLKAQLPEDATTIHRLLGCRPDSTSFRHNAENPLPFDIVAVDEASMVDLALMAKLFQAIPPNARVILLGDKDQLASVEAGAVLGDICAAAGDDKKSLLAPCVVQLKKNFRFGEDSAIFHLSHAINAGDTEKVFQILRTSGAKAKADLVAATLPERAKLKAALKDKVIAGFDDFLKAADPLAALSALGRFRVLCALREGSFGVAGLNRVIEEILDEAGLIQRAEIFYGRRPVMVTQNDYHLKLFNGDLGVIWHDAGGPRACFAGPDQSLRPFLPLRLPAHETAYAMTVHKSQGSEFDRVLFVLPDKSSPILTRELLYTGITRARKNVELWFDEKVFRTALAARVRRDSGLHSALA